MGNLEPQERIEGPFSNAINVSGIELRWRMPDGVCTFRDLPVALMWVDTTLAGLMAGLEAMVGPERFALALQAEGRKSVESDWILISRFPDFETGFEELRLNAAVAAWGDWQLISCDREQRVCVFRVYNNWEGLYQKALGVCWGSALLAGKLAGICTKLFETNCWAEQTQFVARGDAYDEFRVAPSSRALEEEIEKLLETDQATRADMAVAIKKLRETESLLREREERFRGIFEYSPLGMAIVDFSSGLLLHINPRWRDIFGCTPEEAATHTLDTHTHPDYKREEQERLLELRAGAVGKFHMEKRCIRTDGRVIWVDQTVIGAQFQMGPVQLALAEDITERKNAEQLLVRNTQLESLGVLAGGIAHDFNNLLGGIYNHIEVAANLAETDRVREVLAAASETIVRARKLTGQLLGFARGSSVDAHPADMASFLEDTVRFALSGSGVELEFDFRPGLLPALFDRAQLAQAVENIIINARQATGDRGRIVVRAETVPVTAASEDLSPGDYVRITIEDNGPGMSSDVLAHVFEPFYSTRPAGTGLGLTSSLAILRRHGGTIEVDSLAGSGAAFKLYVPAVRTVLPAAPAAEQSVHRGTGRILVMDDEPALLESLGDLLGVLGYEAVLAADGETALKEFRSAAASGQPFKAAVLDLTIRGGMGGLEVVREIRRHDEKTPVYLMTGYVDDFDVSTVQEHGFAGWIPKPFTLAEISTLIAGKH